MTRWRWAAVVVAATLAACSSAQDADTTGLAQERDRLTEAVTEARTTLDAQADVEAEQVRCDDAIGSDRYRDEQRFATDVALADSDVQVDLVADSWEQSGLSVERVGDDTVDRAVFATAGDVRVSLVASGAGDGLVRVTVGGSTGCHPRTP